MSVFLKLEREFFFRGEKILRLCMYECVYVHLYTLLGMYICVSPRGLYIFQV